MAGTSIAAASRSYLPNQSAVRPTDNPSNRDSVFGLKVSGRNVHTSCQSFLLARPVGRPSDRQCIQSRFRPNFHMDKIHNWLKSFWRERQHQLPVVLTFSTSRPSARQTMHPIEIPSEFPYGQKSIIGLKVSGGNVHTSCQSFSLARPVGRPSDRQSIQSRFRPNFHMGKNPKLV